MKLQRTDDEGGGWLLLCPRISGRINSSAESRVWMQGLRGRDRSGDGTRLAHVLTLCCVTHICKPGFGFLTSAVTHTNLYAFQDCLFGVVPLFSGLSRFRKTTTKQQQRATCSDTQMTYWDWSNTVSFFYAASLPLSQRPQLEGCKHLPTLDRHVLSKGCWTGNPTLIVMYLPDQLGVLRQRQRFHLDCNKSMNHKKILQNNYYIKKKLPFGTIKYVNPK